MANTAPLGQALPENLSLPTLTSPEPAAEGEASEEAIVVVSSLGHTLCHVGELMITGTVAAVMLEFGLGPFYAVALPALGYFLMGIGALPFGWWSDAWGTARLLRIYFAALAVAGVAVALAPNVWWLFAGLTLLGIAASIYHPVGLAMISLGVRDRGRAMGVNGAAGSLGVATGPALGMLAASLGVWRLAYVALAIFSLVALVLMWLWMPVGRDRLRTLPPAVPPDAAGSSTRSTERGTSGAGYRYAALVLLMAAMMLGGFNYRCLVTALPPFLTGDEPSAASMARGGLLIWIALVVGGVGQYLGGWLASRIGSRGLYLALLALLVPCALLLRVSEGSGFSTLVACGLAVCLFALQPIENIILADWTSVSRRSLSYAAKFAFTFGVGALGAPVVGKIWSAYHTLGPVFYLVAGSAAGMVLLFLAALRIWEKGRAS